VESDDRGPVLQGEVEHVADLLGVHLPKGAPHEAEVLGVDEDPAAVDGAGPRDHAVPDPAPAVHTEGRSPMLHEGVKLDEAAWVQ